MASDRIILVSWSDPEWGLRVIQEEFICLT